ncbi:putative bifunctional diguanylate cyclase/phosphodiesterase [Telluria aromaticivorans]|uniref:EAL domain-containing protein n=1 Tax=Telluria aromaticivorans TaxID=2725995 RepID=A0A7Y2JX40_9BURK|nr:EAL domain-containing protein [Telluria aromaticivorans]NNG22627.1 EAL domain-containing protein [Telluria aromaticivorans]
MEFRSIGRNSEHFLRAMLKLSSSAILITDAKGIDNPIVFVNPAFEIYTGYRADEVLGRNCRLLQQNDREQPGRAVLSEAIRTGTSCEAIFRNYRKNGQLFWTHLYMFPVTDELGDVTHFVGIQHDITARRKAEHEVTRANAQVASILSRITEGCISVDHNWNITYINAQAGVWLDRRPTDLVGKNLWDEFPQAVGSVFHETYQRVMRTQQFGHCEAFYAPVGRWLEARTYPSEEGLRIFFIDISHRKEYEFALVYAATHDALTGLPNRTACLRTLTRRLHTNSASGDEVAAIFIDLDRFKEINDAFGHAAGDEVLVAIGNRLQKFSSETCYPSRNSGDEFVVIVSGSDEGHIRTLASQLLAAIATPIELRGRDITIGASIGIALAHDGTQTADELLNQADTAMYLTKVNGRHSLSVYNGEANSWDMRRHRLRNDMLHAIQNGEFLLYYQPQLSLRDNSVVGAEALVRWQHPEFGLLSPAAFLEIAEESPLIIEMGAWVFNEACRQLREWESKGHSLKMSVNVSARQLANRDLPEMLAQVTKHHGISADCIKLEVTESMLAQDFDATSQVLAALKMKGFRIALDDFGTGYSNLAYLSRLPVTAIKIDRSFVTALAVDELALPLIKGIVALAKSLNLHVICEGIETEEQRAVLEGTECDSIQGFLTGRPLPAEIFFASFMHRAPQS